ncbi:MAG: 2-hydroxychromene-2-carboxylate isomerase [Alphaproteobacteria bacterium]|nr:2-hydroxychromene-2-carboxylate isomerase [Alphaproteobacteria bacterium]
MSDTTGIVEHYFSIRSSFAYLGVRRISHLAHAHGRRVVHHPLDLQALVARNGGVPYAKSHQIRRDNHHNELERWGRRLDMPVIVEPVHHVGPRERPSGVVILAQTEGHDVDRIAYEILAALWRDDRDIDSPEVLKDLCRKAGLPENLVDRALATEPQAELASNLERALAAGAIGSPTYVIDGEVFFGQDRLSFVEEALLAKR